MKWYDVEARPEDGRKALRLRLQAHDSTSALLQALDAAQPTPIGSVRATLAGGELGDVPRLGWSVWRQREDGWRSVGWWPTATALEAVQLAEPVQDGESEPESGVPVSGRRFTPVVGADGLRYLAVYEPEENHT